jgi:hypothetical protein
MITKLFTNTEIKIAYKTTNTLKNHLKTNKYKLSGVYQLKCSECPHIYIGQTGRPFKTRYNEHREIKNNGENSNFSLHIQNTGHKCANIDETLDVLHVQRKGSMMNVLESYHIYEASKRGIHLNKALSDFYNPIFEIIIKNQPNKTLSTTYNQIQPPPSR